MIKEYEITEEEENILNELDGLCGVIQNKETLKNMILFAKLRENKRITFGNFNMIIRNESGYNIIEDFLKVCGKILIKYNVISNDKICFFDKLINNKRESVLDKILGIEEDIIVINDRKIRLDYAIEIENLYKIVNTYKNKVFVFEDTSWNEGELDTRLNDIATWRMTIDKISLDDKIMYCKKKLEDNGLKCKHQDVKEFANIPLWQARQQLTQVIIECKSKDLDMVSSDIFKKNKGKTKANDLRRTSKARDIDKKTAKQELDELIGLNEVKDRVQKILNYVKLNKNRGNMPSLHMCFTGNPGTGKTSIARIIGKLFTEEHILTGNGEFIEIHGRDLVDKYVGWTANKVKETVENAIGGVLFIDEAYSLVTDRRGSFEDEAIATLIKEMEDHRNEICIIFAGYTDEMRKLIELNPGFESRIQFNIDFPDYSEEELLKIFTGLCKKEKYKLSAGCKNILLENFSYAKKEKGFGNGRYVRNLFEKIKFEQADRIVKTNSKNIYNITEKDIYNSINFKKVEKKSNTIGFIV